MTIPKPYHNLTDMIDRYHENKPVRPRYHLGPSSAGNPCDRSIWLSFRWALKESFEGRILRLFRRGSNEEAVAVNDLRSVGIVIENTGYDQMWLEFGAHVCGSPDGVILSGVPEALNTKHIWENKTHGKKSFDLLEKNGAPEAHVLQMQCYMHGTGMHRALYHATCKDDDRLYFERIEYDKELAEKTIHRLQSIAVCPTLPAPLSTRSDWYQCKMCKHYRFCFQTKIMEKVNCRTCAHSTARGTGEWWCEYSDMEIESEAQEAGCRAHVPHPDLVPWRLDQEKSTTSSAWFEGIGLVGVDGVDSREVIK